MLSLLGLFLMVGGAAGTLWILFWQLLNASSRAGAKLSKKIGTDNEHTDESLEQNKTFTKELKQKLTIRACVTLAGFLFYYFGGK
jgi:hypothetical protein